MKKTKTTLITLLASMMIIASCNPNSKDDNSTSFDDSSEIISEDTSSSSFDLDTSNEDPVTTLYNIVIVPNDDFEIRVTNLDELKASFDTPVIFEVNTINSEAILNAVKVSYIKDGNEELITPNHQGNTYGFYMPEGDVTISVNSTIKEYNVLALSNEYVSILLDQNTAKANDLVTFAVNLLDTNREISSVNVFAGDNRVTTNYANDRYSFTMPSSDVTISVETTSNVFHITTRNASNVYFNLIGTKEEFKEGEEVMFTASSKYGYFLNQVIITDALGQDVAFTKGESSYSFIMPKSDVVIAFDVEQMYQISVSSDDKVTTTINESKDYYRAGSVITFTVSVTDKDYELDTVSVKNGTKDVTYQENDGTYSFTMPNSNVVISATSKKKAGEVVSDPFTNKTTFYGEWDYNDGYTLYYMALTVIFNGDKTLSWKLTYDYDDDDWWSIRPMMKVASNISEKASQNNVGYTYDSTNDQINVTLHIKTQDKLMTIQLVRTAGAVTSIYFTSDMSGDYYQCGNHSLTIKK